MEIKRIIEKTIEEYLEFAGAILISGPKYCGKTFTALKNSKSHFFLQNIKDIEEIGLDTILSGDKPRLIDEWQIYPHIWNVVRLNVDLSCIEHDNRTTQYILTGSTRPYDKSEIRHSGIGRIYPIIMQTLTFAEILALTDENSISIQKLLNNDKDWKNLENPLSVDKVIELIKKGGWPEIYANNINMYNKLVTNYIDQLCFPDRDITYFNVNKSVLNRILKSIARLTSSQMNVSTIEKDLNGDISRKTLDRYISILYDQDFLFDIPIWTSSNIRSSYRITTKPKTYICDTSLVCKLLDINSFDSFYKDLKTAGLIFENQVMKDLTVYAQALNGHLYFYRDEKGNELDAIIEFDDGRWIAIEIKLSEEAAINAAKNMDEVIKKMNLEGSHSQPQLRLIITNSSRVLALKNATLIIPHTVLKP